MKQTLRYRLAATLLLSPIAALVAQPALAQHGTVVIQPAPAVVLPAPGIVAPTIERFVLRPAGRIEPGRELRFTLVGAPGGRAWANIPGTGRDIELREVRPGVYEGNYTVRRRDDPDAFARTVATLQRGPARVTAQVEMRGGRGGGMGRDERPPQISDLSPQQGERVGEWRRTHIGARLSDEGSGVDTANVRLRVDGRDVTDRAVINAEEIRYRDALGDGRHTAELTVGDRAGNVTRRSWSFDVRERERNGGGRDWNRDGDGRSGNRGG